MFPYPSGRIHMGHVRNYAMGDVVARFKRATGFNVLHPMGWDAFGMPAENAAMERKVHPKAWTYQNIAAMKAQLKSMGLSLDWGREIATCDPAYYKHQQKMFLDFLRAGLVERKLGKVNWDPVDQHRARQRAGDRRSRLALRRALVEQREMPQWYFRHHEIFRGFAAGPRPARSLAREGAPHAAQLDRPLRGAASFASRSIPRPPRTGSASSKSSPPVTTLCSAPNSWRSLRIIRWPLAAAAKNPALAGFIAECRRHGTAQELIDTAEKKGFDTGMKALHPFDPDWKLPVYVANFIVMDYGTGAIFGCPAHDQRDLDFANKYGLGNTPVVCPPEQDPATFVITETAYDGDGRMINSRFLDGMTIDQAKEEVARLLEARSPRQSPSRRAPSQFPAARLGHFAPALLGLSDPGHPLRALRHRPGAGKPICRSRCPTTSTSTGRAIRSTVIPPGRTSPARVAGARHGAKPIPWTPSSNSSWYFARFTDPWIDSAPTDRAVVDR